MTTIQLLITIMMAIVGGFFLLPVLLYICSYMIEKGRVNAIKDTKMKSSIKNLLNLTKYGKES